MIEFTKNWGTNIPDDGKIKFTISLQDILNQLKRSLRLRKYRIVKKRLRRLVYEWKQAIKRYHGRHDWMLNG